MHEKLHRSYFTPGTRGFEFIRRFYERNRRELSRLDYSEFDAFLNQVFLGLSSVRWENIETREEHYIIKSIYYQCWNLLFQQKSAAEHRSFDSPPQGDDHETASSMAGADSILEEKDLFAHVVLFKAGLKKDDQRILNALIDDRKLTEVAGELRIPYNNLNVRIRRLRERLAKHLLRQGFQEDVVRLYAGVEKNL